MDKMRPIWAFCKKSGKSALELGGGNSIIFLSLSDHTLHKSKRYPTCLLPRCLLSSWVPTLYEGAHTNQALARTAEHKALTV